MPIDHVSIIGAITLNDLRNVISRNGFSDYYARYWQLSRFPRMLYLVASTSTIRSGAFFSAPQRESIVRLSIRDIRHDERRCD